VRTLICEFQPFFEGTAEPLAEYRDDRRRIRSGSPGRHYHYAYVGQKAVKKGDWALVHNGTNFGIVEIKRVVPGIQPAVTKHVIEVLTQTEFEAYKQRNESIDEMRSMMDELRYRNEQEKELSKFEDLAERDPTAKQMLDKLKEFFGMSSAPALEAAATSSEAPEKAGAE
jgi:TolA-binding protein